MCTLDVIIQFIAIAEHNPATRKNVKSQHKLKNGKEDDLEVGLSVLLFEDASGMQDVLNLTHRLWNLSVPQDFSFVQPPCVSFILFQHGETRNALCHVPNEQASYVTHNNFPVGEVLSRL